MAIGRDDIVVTGGFRTQARISEGTTELMPRLVVALIAVNVAFLTLHLGSFAVLGRVPWIIYLDKENNVPTWWSSAQLLLAGLALLLVAVRICRVRSAAWGLGFVGLVLVVLSLDEMSSVHERAGAFLDRVLGDRDGTHLHHSGLWFAVIGLPFAVGMVFVLRRLSTLLAEVRGSRMLLLLGFAVLLAGAVVVEGATNLLVPDEVYLAGTGRYVLLVGLEEFLEMCGGSLLLWASAALAANHWSTRQIFDHLGPLTAAEAASISRASGPQTRGF